MTSLQWFGVKTLYRSTAQGSPKATDDLYRDDLSRIEERTVLIQAESFDAALDAAEREAEDYASGPAIRNAYGQPVVTSYLGISDAYDMSPDEPGSGVEVYSAMEVVPRSMPDAEIAARAIGLKKQDQDVHSRNFGDISFQDPAPGVERNTVEKQVRRKTVNFLRKRSARSES